MDWPWWASVLSGTTAVICTLLLLRAIDRTRWSGFADPAMAPLAVREARRGWLWTAMVIVIAAGALASLYWGDWRGLRIYVEFLVCAGLVAATIDWMWRKRR